MTIAIKRVLKLVVQLAAFCGATVAFLAAILQISDYAFVEMQGMSIELGCGSPNEGENALIASGAETSEIKRFVEFLESQDGKPVFVSARVQKNCNACGCRRLDQSKYSDSGGAVSEEVVLFDREDRSSRQFGNSRIQREGFEIFSTGPDLFQLLTLPREEHLEGIDRFRRGQWGDLINYNGVFIAHFSGTVQNTRIAYIEPVRSTEPYSKAITCYQDLMDRNVIEELSERSPSILCRGARFWDSDDIDDYFGFDEIKAPNEF